MKKSITKSLLGVILLLSGLVWAQTSAQINGDVNSDASVQASQNKPQTSGSAAASSSVSTQSSGPNESLAAGTTFNTALVTSVDSRKAQAGSQVIARTTENLRAEGKTVLPKGTKLVGHVTKASSRAKGDADSILGIAFDHAVLTNGQEIPLNLTIQALASAQTSAAAADNDIDSMADVGASMASAGASRTRGALGGATSAFSGTAGNVANTAGRVGNAADANVSSSLNSAGGLAGSSQAVGGLNAAGQLTSNSRGVFKLNGLSLTSETTSAANGSVLASTGKNVHLDSGTRMLLATQSTATSGTK
jgi:hypothetical protein